MNYRQIMNSVAVNQIEANAFIKREIAVWGIDEIERLIDSGYVPVKLSNGKWSWLLETGNAVALTV